MPVLEGKSRILRNDDLHANLSAEGLVNGSPNEK